MANKSFNRTLKLKLQVEKVVELMNDEVKGSNFIKAANDDLIELDLLLVEKYYPPPTTQGKGGAPFLSIFRPLTSFFLQRSILLWLMK
jgi:hypothetical protein